MTTSHKGIVIRIIIRVILDVHPVALSVLPFAESVVPSLVSLGDVKMVESPHSLLCRVTIGLKHARLERRHITVFPESADVEMCHPLPLGRKFLPRLLGGADGMRELIVPKLRPARARGILARSVRLHR